MRTRSFTYKCYAIIGILVDNPEAVFALTEQRICERLEKYGWLTRREIEILQKAGKYEYKVKYLNFVPTQEGLEKFNRYNSMLKAGVSLRDLKFAMRGEQAK